ncbi:porphobilinogen deaminase [Yamadazyma tenuis]|uniref:hydroxymethylbilane synthase n=1 Tax=Candida tenuis (strain ATCC 10573 / BCRC 21748 / CBS 615 / JCM 9827 / NBRC 10315 / NRRL Y-1498 / VKM Y-70) TaxID=590646 RepID=G3B7T1_CANTC|nr:porphobilinogen deaminase [Yamadazyma tenuis ATCC 10573]EGV62315.1 porphobilinogen deaminase [Yamadazyma tenuis ATCC 10573]WEJ93573.1 porphobilinogen deaminase [Yamadazyma tenuis]
MTQTPEVALPCPAGEIRIGGRKSELAVAQSEIVKSLIESHCPATSCSIVAIKTLGDVRLDRALYTFGGKSLWTRELEALLLGNAGNFKQIDLIVHSLKDLPTNLPEEFELGCITEREDPRDALVMKRGSPFMSLGQLPAGSVIGTSSMRRSAQLMMHYPHLRFESVRGNLRSRIRKLDEGDTFACIILAAAGMHRIGLKPRITQYLNSDEMYYSVGQGSLGVEIRRGDPRISKILAHIEHIPSAYRCIAERSLMRHLEGGCSVPLGVNTHYDETTKILSFKAIIVSPDGQECAEASIEMPIKCREDCVKAGIQLGDKLVARGGKKILDAIDYQRINQPPQSSSENSSLFTTSSPTTS